MLDRRLVGASSATIRWVRVRGFEGGPVCVTAPALKSRSRKKDSLSEAKRRNASSKSSSFIPLDNPRDDVLAGRIVALLLLLAVPDECAPGEASVSFDRCDSRFCEFRFECCDSGLGEAGIGEVGIGDVGIDAASASAASSSSIVSSNP